MASRGSTHEGALAQRPMPGACSLALLIPKLDKAKTWRASLTRGDALHGGPWRTHDAATEFWVGTGMANAYEVALVAAP